MTRNILRYTLVILAALLNAVLAYYAPYIVGVFSSEIIGIAVVSFTCAVIMLFPVLVVKVFDAWGGNDEQ